MKHMKKILLALLAVLMLSSSLTALAAVKAEAATKKGLVKVKDKSDDFLTDYKYYYYKKGVKIKNAWKSIKVDGKKYRFYFGKKGLACKAKATYDQSYNVKLFKIDGKKYGFDAEAHRVAKGVYVDSNAQLLVFKKNGIYDKKKTTALRKQFKKYIEGGRKTTGLYNELVAAFGKPLSEEKLAPCAAWDGLEMSEFTGVALHYKYFQVQLLQRIETGEYGVIGFFSKEVK